MDSLRGVQDGRAYGTNSGQSVVKFPTAQPSFMGMLISGAPEKPYYYDVITSSVSITTHPGSSVNASVTSNVQVKSSISSASPDNVNNSEKRESNQTSELTDEAGLPFYTGAYDMDGWMDESLTL